MWVHAHRHGFRGIGKGGMSHDSLHSDILATAASPTTRCVLTRFHENLILTVFLHLRFSAINEL